ncbi:MAG: very short patch repair endonuclease [Chitinophagales bacterium]|nr:very short patch repair endonuclease [Chitinophagales bacterium]
MADVHTKKVRSYNMSQIKGKDTKPEKLVRRYIFSKGFRYKLHVKKLPGKPDIVLPKLKVVIFIHGCFWHGHSNCRYFVLPKTRTDWWFKKIERNKQLDNENLLKLRNDGWKVLTIFECKLRRKLREKTLENLIKKLKKISEQREQ